MTDSSGPTLVEFLRARLDERERNAGNYLRFEVRDGVPGNYSIRDEVLADVQAKRRIIEFAPQPSHFPDYSGGYLSAWEDVLQELVQPHADHADFDPEWKL